MMQDETVGVEQSKIRYLLATNWSGRFVLQYKCEVVLIPPNESLYMTWHHQCDSYEHSMQMLDYC